MLLKRRVSPSSPTRAQDHSVAGACSPMAHWYQMRHSDRRGSASRVSPVESHNIVGTDERPTEQLSGRAGCRSDLLFEELAVLVDVRRIICRYVRRCVVV